MESYLKTIWLSNGITLDRQPHRNLPCLGSRRISATDPQPHPHQCHFGGVRVGKAGTWGPLAGILPDYDATLILLYITITEIDDYNIVDCCRAEVACGVTLGRMSVADLQQTYHRKQYAGNRVCHC